MKLYLFAAVGILLLTACSSSKKSKYDFSNVQSTSLDAMHPSPRVFTVDTTIVIAERSPHDLRTNKSVGNHGITNDTVAPKNKYDFSNVQSTSTDGIEPASKICGEPVIKPDPTVPRQDPTDN